MKFSLAMGSIKKDNLFEILGGYIIFIWPTYKFEIAHWQQTKI